MNMIDILLANSLSPKSSSQEQAEADMQAKQDAAEAKQIANEVKESLPNILDDISNLDNSLELETTENDEAAEMRLKIKNNRAKVKNYKNAGTNEDGSMTQKAIKEYVDSKEVNFGAENQGKIVVVNNDGRLSTGSLKEEDLIHGQDEYEEANIVGLEIDYENRSFVRLEQAANYSMGADFNNYPIYKNINRCLVDDNGEIIAFYGDNIYLDDYTSGYQTMVYIPKFYYKRNVISLEDKVIKKEQIYISDKPQTGFKLHPAFINANGEEVNYILYSAYEGSTFDVSANGYNRTDTTVVFDEDKLASIAQAKPLSGINNELTLETAEQLAQNRGTNWHITSIKAESAIQMLAIIEFGMLNGQTALEEGISKIQTINGVNCASYTGSTASLGNITGHAEETINEKNGIETTYNEPGYRAISYRGIENPWGNIWRLIQGIKIVGTGSNTKGGVPYICSGLNFATDEYAALDFTLPNNSDWISNFGYNADFDYLFIPTSANGANSILPIGDYIWVQTNLNGTNLTVLGGNWSFKENNGLFYYGFDRAVTYSGKNYSARLMFIPSKDNIYERNLLAFKASIGG